MNLTIYTTKSALARKIGKQYATVSAMLKRGDVTAITIVNKAGTESVWLVRTIDLIDYSNDIERAQIVNKKRLSARADNQET